MLNSLFRPSFLIPFALVTPYLFIGRVGVTWFEALLIGMLLLRIITKGSVQIRPIIITYALLLLAGYFIALVNADLNYGIPTKLGDLKIFYWLLLAVAGFHFGYINYQDIGKIGQSRAFKFTLIVLGMFVASYPFLSDGVRELAMRNYYHPEIDAQMLGRIYSARFPGLGVNANIFAFMILIAYYIMLKTAFENKVSWIYPLFGLVIITVTGSKTVFALAFLLAVNIFWFSSVSREAKVKVFAGSIALFGSVVIYILATESGQQLHENIVIIDRFIQLTEARSEHYDSPQEIRLYAWSRGMERVELSPIAGIVLSPNPQDFNIVDFCCPHNEFIAYWTFSGFLGLLAYVTLIIGLIIKNRRSPQAHFWIGLYLALCIQMFFDAAFQSPRFIPLMFLVIGLNLRELEIYRTQRRQISNQPSSRII